jgi:hypothetical protein
MPLGDRPCTGLASNQPGLERSSLSSGLRHGDWDRWVAERCALSRATANRYMRLASRPDRLTPYVTIREAYLAAGVINPRRPRSKSPPEAFP